MSMESFRVNVMSHEPNGNRQRAAWTGCAGGRGTGRSAAAGDGGSASPAVQDGVAEAVPRATAVADRAAYQRFPEEPDEFWDDAEAWGAP